MNKRIGANHKKNLKKRSAQRYKKVRKILPYVPVVLLIVALVVTVKIGWPKIQTYAIEAFESSDFLSIKRVEIRADCPGIKLQAAQTLDTIITGKLFHLKKETVKQALKPNSSIGNVRVLRRISGKVTVVITGREPIAMVSRERISLIDKQGVLFPIEKGVFYDIPLVTGTSKLDEQGRIRQEETERIIRFIDSAKRQGDAFYKQISQLDITNKDFNRFSFQTCATVYLSGTGSVQKELRYARRIRELLAPEPQSPLEVNLKYEDMAFVTMK